jgi:O-antigen ligase
MSHTVDMVSDKFRLFNGALKIAATALVLFLCLFADSHVFETNGIGSILYAFAAAFRDTGVQWMVFLCVAVNLLTLLLLQCRISGISFWRTANSSLWLMGLLLLGALVYAFNYSVAAQSTQALMLLAGAALGSGAAVWADFKIVNRKPETENKTELLSGVSLGVLIVPLLTILLAMASLWCPNLGSSFQYRGDMRWTGPWDNPNIYGLLMGVGVTLAFGLLIQSLMSTRLCNATARQAVQGQKQEGLNWKSKVKRYAVIVVCLFAAILMGRGLLHSYSRGAWVAVICGVGYLACQVFRCRVSSVTPWVRANILPVMVIMLSFFVLAFWQFRQTEWHPARRAFSSANINDFSWRNRIAAWEGTLQIVTEHPWFGAGWNQPASFYENYYLPAKVEESAAIQLNDYLMLGATLGIPALFCFVTYIWLSLNQKSEVGDRQVASPALNWSRTVCRAGAIMLAVGFWFDGGLFNLPTASTFWILLELGSVKLAQTKVTASENR